MATSLLLPPAVLLVGSVAVLVTIAGLRRRWQLDSAAAVLRESGARVIPLPVRRGQWLRRTAIEQVNRACVVMPSGSRHAAHRLVVRIAPGDEFSLAGGASLQELAADLADCYLAHARESGWTITKTPVVVVEVDPRLKQGWVCVQAADARGRDLAPLGGTPLFADDGASAVAEAAEPTERLTAPGTRDPRHLLEPIAGAPALGRVRDGVLGRSADVEIACLDSRVSRRHVRFTWAVTGWAVHDLESLNGTYVDGVKARHGQVLRPGQVVTLGDGGPSYLVRVAPTGRVHQ